MESNIEWYKTESIKRTIKNLENHNMKGFYIENKEELLSLLDQLIPDHTTVGVGDSLTMVELGVLDYFRERNIQFLDKYKDNITRSEKEKLYINNFASDTFVCSTNALTEQGELFNIDGNGSELHL